MLLPWQINLVYGLVNRGANVLTKCCKKPGAKHNLVSSKNRVSMDEGQRK